MRDAKLVWITFCCDNFYDISTKCNELSVYKIHYINCNDNLLTYEVVAQRFE